MDKSPVLFGEVLFDHFNDGSRVLGGAPFNVAWNLQAFAASPLLISGVGDDALGRRIRQTMQHWGMTIVGLQMDPLHPTGRVEVAVDGGEPSFDIPAEQAYDFIQASSLPPMEPALIYHGSLALRHPEAARALEELRRRSPAPIFLDVNLRPPWWDKGQVARLLDDARWTKLNEHEVTALVEGSTELKAKAEKLIERHGMELVIVTRGGEGAFMVDDEGAYSSISPTSDEALVDTVGAGDAFASVCILGILQHWDVQTTLSRAQAFATGVIGMRGATVGDRDFYRRFARQWGI